MGGRYSYLGGRRQVSGIKERPIEPDFAFVETKKKQKIKVFTKKPEGWFDNFLGIQYTTGLDPNAATIREQDSKKGQRETILYGRTNKVFETTISETGGLF